MRILLVGGDFGETPSESKLIVKIAKIITECEYFGKGAELNVHNGGQVDALRLIAAALVPVSDVVIWMPNIANDEDKIINSLKKLNPKTILVGSKRLDGRDLKMSDLIGKMLQDKINLLVTIDKDSVGYKNEIIDPLGNSYCTEYDSIHMIRSLLDRTEFLTKAKRVPTIKKFIDCKYVDDGFLEIVRSFGDRFAEFVEQINPTRLLGNASTRCSFGFQSEKQDGVIFVSKRNVDKQAMGAESMVAVIGEDGHIAYCGDNKPSVDTPIQVKLYEMFPNINYIIHGHCYVQRAKFTHDKVPCGDLREVDEIAKMNLNGGDCVINLRGHGCLILATDLSYFDKIELMARPFLEK